MAHPTSTVRADGARDLPAQLGVAGLEAARIVDVREPDEFDGPLGHIEDAELVPLATVAAAASGWARDRPLVVVCRSGARSGRAAAQLAAMGFDVYNLTGGMTAWNAAGLPVVRK